MTPINQLLPSQQDELRKYLDEYRVLTEWNTGKKYVLYEGREVDYNSITTTRFLKG